MSVHLASTAKMMQLVNRKAIQQFIRRHPLARKPFERWIHDVTATDFSDPQQVKERWPNASLLSNAARRSGVESGSRVVFNIHGNHYRILVDVDYELGIVTVLRIGTHGEYDKWNL